MSDVSQESRTSVSSGQSRPFWAPYIFHLVVATVVVTVGIFLQHFIIGPEYFFIQSEELTERLLEKLQGFAIPAPSQVLSYVSESESPHTLQPIRLPASSVTPDVTAILLNWSRKENVKLISRLLCDHSLEDIVAQIFIWNNNPNTTLVLKDFEATGCSPSKLILYNSPINEFFQARYKACTQVNTTFCFVQDDDYIVQPTVIRNMFKFSSTGNFRKPIHLSPSHDHLLSSVRSVETDDEQIHSSFAWLGYGTLLTSDMAVDFLRLIKALNFSAEEMKMADNYFSILANQQAEVWFDHGIELGGGQPFTIGEEGNARNDLHIEKAFKYLTNIVGNEGNIVTALPYTSRLAASEEVLNRTPCLLASCVVQSNVKLLPGMEIDRFSSPSQITEVTSRTREKLKAIGDEHIAWYMEYPLSSAVDGDPKTSFRSPFETEQDEFITFDALSPIPATLNQSIQLVLLVDEDTETLLKEHSSFSYSANNIDWKSISGKPNCAPADLLSSRQNSDYRVIECSVTIDDDGISFSRYIQIKAGASKHRWVVYEIWLREVAK